MAAKRAAPPAAKRPRAARPSTTRTAAGRPRNADVEAALAAFAHEIRTPLTGLLALGELLAASEIPAQERQWAVAVKSAAEHLALLTTLVVDGARARRKTLVSAREPFDPRLLARTVATALSVRAAVKGLAVETAIAADLPGLVIGDPVRLRAALENMIDNAVKFTERGRVGFSVATRPAGRGRTRLLFAVRDSGIGMTTAQVKRLYRPFRQASDRVAKDFGGAGLGLVFVERLAKAMHGKVSVESTPGSGSTFCLSVTVETPSAAASWAASLPVPIRSLRVLVAEDNPHGRVILNTILTELGHQAFFVGTGRGAVEAVRRRPHDIVLMDIVLPGIDGIEAVRRIRALSGRAARTPVIGLSGRGAPEDEAAARAAGMNDYLVKPVSPSALAAAMRAQVAP